MKIKIKVNDISVKAKLYDNKMAKDIWDVLPLKGIVKTWGDEIYFPIPIKTGYSNKKAVVDVGELGFWKPGNAFCIFFGPTPGSDKPKPANPVDVFGKVIDDPKIFKKISNGAKIKIEKI
jgi:hypothetical protein